MNIKLWLVTGLLLPLLLGLGVWQLQRGEQKTKSLAQFEKQLQSPAMSLQSFLSQHPLESDQSDPAQRATAMDSGRYSNIELSGRFVAPNWLLDNQIQNGQFGYGVFTPFCTESTCILVDRGWIRGSLNREELPVLTSPEGAISISGQTDLISRNPMIGANDPLQNPPFRVQQIDHQLIQSHLDLPLTPWIVHLDKEAPGAYKRVWQPVVMGPEKHIGYAVQWFAMAAALCLLVLWLQFRGKTQAGESV